MTELNNRYLPYSGESYHDLYKRLQVAGARFEGSSTANINRQITDRESEYRGSTYSFYSMNTR